MLKPQGQNKMTNDEGRKEDADDDMGETTSFLEQLQGRLNTRENMQPKSKVKDVQT